MATLVGCSQVTGADSHNLKLRANKFAGNAEAVDLNNTPVPLVIENPRQVVREHGRKQQRTHRRLKNGS